MQYDIPEEHWRKCDICKSRSPYFAMRWLLLAPGEVVPDDETAARRERMQLRHPIPAGEPVKEGTPGAVAICGGCLSQPKAPYSD